MDLNLHSIRGGSSPPVVLYQLDQSDPMNPLGDSCGLNRFGPYSYGLNRFGPYSYGLHRYGLYSYGLYRYGLHSYGLYSYGR